MELLWAFLSGALLANAVPHFVHGVSGERFFTPFSRRNAMSPAVVNVLWAAVNIGLGAWLFRVGQVATTNHNANQVWFAVGGLLIAILNSVIFAKRLAAKTK
jgi:hypothetical protein